MDETTRSDFIHKSSEVFNTPRRLAQLNTIRVTPMDPATPQEDIIHAITNTATDGITNYHYLGGEEKLSEFQLTSANDYEKIKESCNSEGIIRLNEVDLKIILFEEDAYVFTIRYVPLWLTEEETHEELKLAFGQSAKVFNIHRQTKKFVRDEKTIHLPGPHYWFSVTGAELIPTGIQFGEKISYIYLKDQCRKCGEIGHWANSDLCKARTNKTQYSKISLEERKSESAEPEIEQKNADKDKEPDTKDLSSDNKKSVLKAS